MYFNCIVKFKGRDPIFMGISNVSQVNDLVNDLLTMKGAEWVQGPFSGDGTLLDISGRMYHGTFSDNVAPHQGNRVSDDVLTPEVMEKVKAALAMQRKITAIKEVRLATNWSLKESKDFVDFLADHTDWYPPF